jgi:transcriptional regulator with XRE-family HTH domain
MTDDPTPTTLRRQLGLRLRQLRQGLGVSAQEIAEGLDVSLSKVSRMETGARAVNDDDITAIAAYLRLEPDVAGELRILARQGRRRRTPTSPASSAVEDDITIRQSGFLDLERDAVRIREFNGGVVPGLLQTEDYMHAVIIEAAPGIKDDLVDAAMTTRLRRQRVLGDGRHYEVIVDESVLLRRVGGAVVMRGQVLALREAVANGVVSLKVVPLGAGSHPAVNSMFVSLRVSDPLAPDIVFVEGLGGHLKFERPEEVERFDRIWDLLERMTEEASTTRQRLDELIDFYRR